MTFLEVISLGGWLLYSSSGAVADLENGRRLHEQHCMRCHDTSIYQREDRRINNLVALRAQVRACELGAELAWFEEEVEDVTMWLQQQYYQFPAETQ